MTDERLRHLYSRALEVRKPGDQCPSPQALLRLVRQEGPEARRLETLDHVMACVRCRSELDLLHAIEQAGRTAGEQKETHARLTHPTLSRSLALALAASLVIAIGLGPARRFWQGETPESTRGPAAVLTLLAPDPGATAEAPVTFVWRPLPDIRDYTVEILTQDGSPAFTSKTSDTILVAPAVHSLPPGKYQWWVRAVTTNDIERRSDLRRVRIRAK